MGDKFADKFRIKSGRLENWDYSSSGMYFITICTMNHNNFLGKVEKNKMYYSNKGLLAYKCLIKIPVHFKNIKLVEYVIMPNHVHILLKLDNDEFVYSRDVACYVSTNKKERMSNISPKKNSVSTIMRSYKSAVTKSCREQNLFFAWQSRYYDEIVNNEKRLKLIENYIKNNPKNWEKDKFF